MTADWRRIAEVTATVLYPYCIHMRGNNTADAFSTVYNERTNMSYERDEVLVNDVLWCARCGRRWKRTGGSGYRMLSRGALSSDK